MPAVSLPSASELCLLKALWRDAPLSARALHEAVAGELVWSFSSTRKTLERMLEKGMVRQHSAHGVQVYAAALDKVATLAAFARDFGRRVMDIEAPLPVAAFSGSGLLDQEELQALQVLLAAEKR
jgi:predicted transcriptional regulator